jgi:hypothetical protein
MSVHIHEARTSLQQWCAGAWSSSVQGTTGAVVTKTHTLDAYVSGGAVQLAHTLDSVARKTSGIVHVGVLGSATSAFGVSNSSLQMTVGKPVPAGNTVIAHFAVNGDEILGCTLADSEGNTWIKDDEGHGYNSDFSQEKAGVATFVCTLTNPLSVGSTITGSLSAATTLAKAITAVEFSGISTSNRNDPGGIIDTDITPHTYGRPMLARATTWSGYNNVDQSSYATSSIGPTANRWLVVDVWARDDAGSVAAPTITGLSLTWINEHTKISADGTRVLRRAYAWTGAAPGSGALTFNFGAATMDGCAWHVYMLGEDVDASDPFMQSASAESASGTSPSVTLSAFASPNNRPLVACSHDANEASAPEFGYTELADVNGTSPSVGLAVAYNDGFTDTSPSYSFATSTTALVIASEVKMNSPLTQEWAPPASQMLVLGRMSLAGPNTDGFTADTDANGGDTWHDFAIVGTSGGTASDNISIRHAYKITTARAPQIWNPILPTSRSWLMYSVALWGVPEHTIDAVVQVQGLTRTHTVDAVAQATSSRTHTTDSVVRTTPSLTNTVDAYVQAAATRTHTLDAVVQATSTRAHTLDAAVQTTLTRAHTTDAVVVKTTGLTHTIDAAVFSKPINLTATAVSSSQIDLNWDDVPGADEYQVERDGVIIANTASSSYSDTGLTASTLYAYRVRALMVP